MEQELEFYRAMHRLQNTSDGKVFIDYLNKCFIEDTKLILEESGNNLYKLQGEMCATRDILLLFEEAKQKIEDIKNITSIANNSKNIY